MYMTSRIALPAIVLSLTLAGCGGDGNNDNSGNDPQPGSPGLGDSLYPGFGNGGYQVEHYTLDIKVTDVETSTLAGVATLEAEATQALSRFNLDFIGMTVDGVRVDGQDAAFTRDGQELIITPADALADGEPFTVEVSYHGSPEQIESVALPVLTGWVIYDGGSFVLSEPDGAANYYPVNDHPLDKASYTFRITAPKPYEVAANGILVSTADNGDSTTFVFDARDPMASYLTTVNIDEFDLFTSTGPNNLPLRDYFPEGIDPAFRVPFARQAQIIDFFNALFGIFPFEVYGSVMVDTELGGALETQTLSIFGADEFYIDDPVEGELIVVHETAHQWYGNSVAVDDWRDIWINEGFASYAEWLWIEYTQGVDAMNARIVDTYDFVATDEDASLPGDPQANDLFNLSGSYFRPALLLHALRLEMGSDDLFFAFTRAYPTRYANSNAGRDELIALAEEISGQDLDDFFDAWLFDTTLPPIPQLGLSVAKSKAGGVVMSADDPRVHKPGRWIRHTH